MTSQPFAYIDANRVRMLENLFDFLRIPSISAQSEHIEDVHAAADFLCGELRELGLHVEKITSEGNPLVYAQTEIDPKKPTILIYGHYDVQPVDPRINGATRRLSPWWKTAISMLAAPATTRGNSMPT
jgi:acetylornithine deacetylase/succinyl-diaminopimelate desuccinylase-like protein